MIVSRFIHVVANGIFFFMAGQYSIVYMYHIFFIHSSVDGHLCCFRVLAIVNSADMNIGVCVSCWIIAHVLSWACSIYSRKARPGILPGGLHGSFHSLKAEWAWQVRVLEDSWHSNYFSFIQPLLNAYRVLAWVCIRTQNWLRHILCSQVTYSVVVSIHHRWE